MGVRAVHRYLAHTVGLCCQIPFSPEVVSCTYDLRVTGQLLVTDMKLSGPRRPLAVVGLFTETAARSPALAIRVLTQITLTANGPSLLLLEGLSPSAFTLSALTILETVSITISSCTMDPMLILHPLDRIVAQTLI